MSGPPGSIPKTSWKAALLYAPNAGEALLTVTTLAHVGVAHNRTEHVGTDRT
jgi:hypothetical protein